MSLYIAYYYSVPELPITYGPKELLNHDDAIEWGKTLMKQGRKPKKIVLATLVPLGKLEQEEEVLFHFNAL